MVVLGSLCPVCLRLGTCKAVVRCQVVAPIAAPSPPVPLSLADRKTIANAMGRRGQWLTTR
jgi:hypothetical protein